MFTIDKERLRKRKDEIISFLHEHEYSDYTIEDFLECINSETENINCALYQLYSKFGVVPKEADIYIYFRNLLNKYKFLQTNCCEIAAGKYPRLAEIVYPELRRNNKTLTIYEPDLVIDSLEDVIVKKELFTKNSDLKGIDTLFGTFTCEATIDVVEKALIENRNLLISLCECDHSTEKYPFLSQQYFTKKINDMIAQRGSISVLDIPNVYWYDCFQDQLKKEYGDRISILNWPEIYGFEYPIILSVTEEHKRKHLKL